MSNFLSDIAALAKSGYSVADIKELLSLSTNSSTSEGDKPSDTPQSEGDNPSLSQIKETGIKNENQEINKNDSSSSDTEEYTKKIADLESKVSDLTEKLSKAQKDNVRSDMADASKEKDAATILSEMAQSYM